MLHYYVIVCCDITYTLLHYCVTVCCDITTLTMLHYCFIVCRDITTLTMLHYCCNTTMPQWDYMNDNIFINYLPVLARLLHVLQAFFSNPTFYFAGGCSFQRKVM